MITRRGFLGTGLLAGSGLADGVRDDMDPALGGIAGSARALRDGRTSSLELVRSCLSRIERLDPKLNAFITVLHETALEDARARDAEIASGRWRGALHGIPIALKDNIDTAGVRTTAAAAGFADRIPDADAAVLAKLREAGAILLGKLNMDECAYGVTSTTGHFGPVRNPWSPDHVAGGSSGGPAAAVAAGLCHAALGTDTGGSVRQPAAWCGVTGLKPTFGLVSTRGVIPLSWSLDHVGPIARSALDAALLLAAVAGFDPEDPGSLRLPVPDPAAVPGGNVRGLRVGRPRTGYFEKLDPEIDRAVGQALKDLEALTGTSITTIDLPAIPPLAVLFVEAASRYGPELERRPDGFSRSIHSLVAMGRRIEATKYAEARRQLELARRSVLAVFDAVDLIAMPVTPDMPASVGAGGDGEPPRGPPLSARNTTPINIYGLPAISVPCGFGRHELPIGLQLCAAPGRDDLVLATAHAYQRVTAWHRRSPAPA